MTNPQPTQHTDKVRAMDIQQVRDAVAALPMTEAGRVYVGAWMEGAPATRGAGFRAWMKSHNGKSVDTLQFQTDGTRPWVAQGRTVSARSTFVEFDGSRRDYASMHVVASDDTHMVASNGSVVVLYRVAQ